MDEGTVKKEVQKKVESWEKICFRLQEISCFQQYFR